MKIRVTFDIDSDMPEARLLDWFMRTMDLWCETMPTGLKNDILKLRRIKVADFRREADA